MASAEAVRLAIGYQNGGRGVPATVTDKKIFRYTSESLGSTANAQESPEMNDGGQPQTAVRESIQSTGGIDGVLHESGWEESLDGLLYADLTGNNSLSTGLNPAVQTNVGINGNKYNKTGGFTTANGFTNGGWVLASGFPDATANGIARVTTRTDNDLTVEGLTLPASVTAAAGQHVEPGQLLIPDTVLSYFTIERYHTDISTGNPYIRFIDAIPTSLDVNMPTTGPITVSFGYITGTPSFESTALGGTYNAASSNEAFTGVQNAVAWFEGGAGSYTGIPCRIQGSFRITNGARAVQCQGESTPSSFSRGSFSATGNTTFLFDGDTSIPQKFLDNELSGLAFSFVESAGTKGMLFHFPATRYSSYSAPARGKGTDIQVSMDWSAEQPAGGSFVEVYSFDAA